MGKLRGYEWKHIEKVLIFFLSVIKRNVYLKG